jgi:ankyrin repeat protein
MNKKLLEYGANINAQNINGASSLIIASVNGNEKIAEILLRVDGIKLDMLDTKGATALTFAAKNNYPVITKALLDAGADSSIRDIYHKSALDYAIIEGSTESLDALIAYNTKELTEDDMMAAHHFAIESGNTETIQKINDIMLNNGLVVMDIGPSLSLSLNTLYANNEEILI